MSTDEAWSRSDAERLRHARNDAGLDVPTLAKHACLSVAQVHQLEDGGDSCFYTPEIKRQAGIRALASAAALKLRGQGKGDVA